MTREQILRILPGIIILISLYLDGRISTEPSWLWLTAFVGLNLLQSGLTKWCLAEQMLKKFNIGKA